MVSGTVSSTSRRSSPGRHQSTHLGLLLAPKPPSPWSGCPHQGTMVNLRPCRLEAPAVFPPSTSRATMRAQRALACAKLSMGLGPLTLTYLVLPDRYQITTRGRLSNWRPSPGLALVLTSEATVGQVIASHCGGAGGLARRPGEGWKGRRGSDASPVDRR